MPVDSSLFRERFSVLERARPSPGGEVRVIHIFHELIRLR
jgi:hypothetical protein